MESKKELINKSKQRAKKQNQRALELWDCVSCRLPKGTKDRIIRSGNTVNGLINDLVLEYLENIENNK